MKFWKLALCAAVASVGMGGAALAQTPSIAFNAGLANQYIFRGIEQSSTGSNKAEAFAGADATLSLGYAGVWTSTTNWTGKPMEVDVYGGVRPTFDGVGFDFGAIYYGYTKNNDGLHYWELKAGASKAFGPATIGGVFYYSPEFPGHLGAAEYYEADLSYTVKKATVSGALGYQNLDDAKNLIGGYTTWNIGVTYPITDHFSIDARYIGTGDNVNNTGYGYGGSHYVATLKATF